MDEWVQIDEVIDDYLLHLFPIYDGPELVEVDHVLHEEGSVQLQLGLVTDEGVFHHYEALLRGVLDDYVLVLLR
jgi:hypothetical protein